MTMGNPKSFFPEPLVTSVKMALKRGNDVGFSWSRSLDTYGIQALK